MAEDRSQQFSQSLKELQALLGQLNASADQASQQMDRLEKDLESLRSEFEGVLAGGQGEVERLGSQVTQVRVQSAATLTQAEDAISRLQVDLGSTVGILSALASQVEEMHVRNQRAQQLALDYLAVMQRESNHLVQGEGKLSAQPDPTIRAIASLLQLSVRLAVIVFPPEELEALAVHRDRLVVDSLRQHWIEWLGMLTGYLTHVLPLARSLELVQQQGLLNDSYRQALAELAEQCRALGSSVAPLSSGAPVTARWEVPSPAPLVPISERISDEPSKALEYRYSVIMVMEGLNGSSLRQNEIEVVRAGSVEIDTQFRTVMAQTGYPARLRLERDARAVSFWLSAAGQGDRALLMRIQEPVAHGEYAINIVVRPGELTVRLRSNTTGQVTHSWTLSDARLPRGA